MQGQSIGQIAALLEQIRSDHKDKVQHYAYDRLGNLTQTHTGSNGEQLTRYNVFGEVEETSTRINATKQKITTLDYDNRGLVAKSSTAGINKSYEYNFIGSLIRSTDGRGNACSYSVNRRGEQIRIFDDSGYFKNISYDAFGRVLTETDFTGSMVVKLYAYDDVSNTLTVEIPESQSTIITQFNAFGDKILYIDANANESIFAYDEKGQLISVKGPENSSKEFYYDNLGNIVLGNANQGAARPLLYTMLPSKSLQKPSIPMD